MFVAAAGALANLISLIVVSLSSGTNAEGWSWFFIFISTGYYVLLFAALEVFALCHFGEISTRLKQIQYSTEQRVLFED
jgi:hypothetical protein